LFLPEVPERFTIALLASFGRLAELMARSIPEWKNPAGWL
jgi:hypothetical protein